MENRRDHINSNFPPSALAWWFDRGGKLFTPRQFLIRSGVAFLIVALVSVAIHVGVDLYGLFRPVKDREVKIYHEERISKYLLMHEYVPANFNGLIMGTSLSDNLDISAYNRSQKEHRFYNASMMGANISEVRRVALKGMEGGIRDVIFCVSPYQFKNSGAKEVELDDKLYFGALGSWNLYETYAVALIRMSGLMPHKYPAQHINADGVNNFTARYRADDVAERIRQVADAHRGEPFVIDPHAWSEFKALLTAFRRREIRFMIYFHPVPQEVYDAQSEAYREFETKVKAAVGDDRLILDLNEDSWDPFVNDYSNYIDNGHLSEKGQATVTVSIMERFRYIYH